LSIAGGMDYYSLCLSLFDVKKFIIPLKKPSLFFFYGAAAVHILFTILFDLLLALDRKTPSIALPLLFLSYILLAILIYLVY